MTITAYLSPTCPACRQWHEDVLPQLKRAYLDKGRARLVFKETPSHDKIVDAAIFAIARCSDAQDYLLVLDVAFAARDAIEQASHSPAGPRQVLNALAALSGHTGGEVDACLDSAITQRRLSEVRAEAIARGVKATPTLIIDGQLIDALDLMDASRLLAIVAARLPAAR
ncbi:MAG: thioredoxin domain-containing protein [Hyphomonadaceae bacterium]